VSEKGKNFCLRKDAERTEKDLRSDVSELETEKGGKK